MRNFYFAFIFLAVLIGSCQRQVEKPDDLTTLNDEFTDQASLVNWKISSAVEALPSRLEEIDIDTTAPDCLYWKTKEGIWWRGYHGVFLYKELKGDFIVSTKLMVKGREKEFPDYPQKHWQVAGLMIRKPTEMAKSQAERLENWVFNTFGGGIRETYLFDTGETRDNNYTCFPDVALGPEWVELRLIRIGKYVVSMTRNQGEDWLVRVTLDRPDLPQTVQVGLMSNSSGFLYPFLELKKNYDYATYNSLIVDLDNKPDLRAYFDYIRFKRPGLDVTEFEAVLTDNPMDNPKFKEFFGF